MSRTVALKHVAPGRYTCGRFEIQLSRLSKRCLEVSLPDPYGRAGARVVVYRATTLPACKRWLRTAAI